jgi:3-methylcrotonyl-CoA carboxylase alpha subunit
VTTNAEFLAACAAHPAFARGEIDTGFIGRHRDELVPERASASDTVLGLASLAVLLGRERDAAVAASQSNDPYSPWHSASGWRLNDDNHHTLTFRDGDETASVVVHYRRNGHELELSGRRVTVRGEMEESGDLVADIGGRRVRATVVRHGNALSVFAEGRTHRLDLIDPLVGAGEEEGGSGALTAPMPGKVVQVLAVAGDKVEAGAALVVLEAMKMEHTIAAPADGTVSAVHYEVGDLVEDGASLIDFEAE